MECYTATMNTPSTVLKALLLVTVAVSLYTSTILYMSNEAVSPFERELLVSIKPPPKATLEKEMTDNTTPKAQKESLVEHSASTTPKAQTVVATRSPLEHAQPTLDSFKTVNEDARASLVNIFCEIRKGVTLRTITGSGVIVDSRGVILTNAHIAQYFLLEKYSDEGATTCIVRAGSLARNAYTATLLYIPSLWVSKHASEITLKSPEGTGEDDYAFLYITGSVDNTKPLPTSLSHLPLNTSEEVVGKEEPVLIASYPAITTIGQNIKNNLYLTSTTAYVRTFFTFSENLLDLFSLSKNIVAERGSSGGAVVNQNGELVGLIVTSTDDKLLLSRELRAITPAHINRSLIKENGTSVETLLSGDLLSQAKVFNTSTSPMLRDLLKKALAQ